jgi:PIN domain nuclease of toxin-antitoxin system
LGSIAKEIILNADNKLFVSSVSTYEIMYKHRIGKLSEYDAVAADYFEALQTLGAYPLPLEMNHAYYAGKFDWSHRDPFDRQLAAQAFTENLTLITNDPAFQSLSWVSVLW